VAEDDKKFDARGAVNKGVATGQRGLSIMENITSWMVNVSYLMPGAGGRKMRGNISQVRGVQYEAYEGLEMPGRVDRVVKAAAPGVGGPATNTAVGGYASAPTAIAPAPTATLIHHDAPTVLAQAGTARPGWSVTPYIDPGQSLVVQLLVSPLRAPRSQHYAFRILSRTAEEENAPPVIEHGTVALKGVGIGRRILSTVLFLLSLALLGLLAWYLAVQFGLL
jgi:hypothetical protein